MASIMSSTDTRTGHDAATLLCPRQEALSLTSVLDARPATYFSFPIVGVFLRFLLYLSGPTR
jgi:hypothetical protein